MRKRAVCHLFCLILPLVLLVGCGFGPKPHPGWSGATGGEQLERQFWKDIKAKNIDELQKHMATSWVALLPGGAMDKAATLELFRQMDLADYTLGEFSVTPNGRDMVVTYTVMMRGTVNGQPLPEKPLKMMTVWQHTKRGWMAIAHANVR